MRMTMNISRNIKYLMKNEPVRIKNETNKENIFNEDNI